MATAPLRQRKANARREYALANVFRKHRRGRGGDLDLNKTLQITGFAVMSAQTFPDRSGPIVLRTGIEVQDNAGTHEGLIFEIGGATRSMAAWVEDDKIGFRAGGAAAGAEVALASYDAGAELQVGRRFELVFFAHPGTGEVRIWDRGIELARATASGGDFGGDWAGSGGGSFASAPNGTVAGDVPAGSQQAPDGYLVTRALDVYVGQIPRFFA